MARMKLRMDRQPSTLRSLMLVVDEEIYGPVQLARSLELVPGAILKFPGYGQVRIVQATADTLTCTQDLTKPVPVPEPKPVLSDRFL